MARGSRLGPIAVLLPGRVFHCQERRRRGENTPVLCVGRRYIVQGATWERFGFVLIPNNTIQHVRVRVGCSLCNCGRACVCFVGHLREVSAAVGGLLGDKQPSRGPGDHDAALLLPNGGRRHLPAVQRSGECLFFSLVVCPAASDFSFAVQD